jgi:hypothetical protein
MDLLVFSQDGYQATHIPGHRDLLEQVGDVTTLEG